MNLSIRQKKRNKFNIKSDSSEQFNKVEERGMSNMKPVICELLKKAEQYRRMSNKKPVSCEMFSKVVEKWDV